MSSLEIRKCQGIAEFEACVRLQKEVWNFSDLDLIPLRMFVVAEKVGGQVIGSFDGKELVGFALSIPGTRNNHAYLHSHMLAVRDGYRDAGLGRKMKLLQRDDAIGRGIDLIEWTFDPLEIKNSYLNIEKLGAISRRYTCNQYGISSSPLHGGLPTDRLVAEWWIRSRRVETALDGKTNHQQPEVEIAIPGKISDWKADPENRERAKRIQSENREVFLKAFRNGLAVLGYKRDAQGDGKFLLGHWDEKWSYATSSGAAEGAAE